jgi:hypothetical protein
MVYFQTKTPSFGTFWKPIERKILISFMTIWHTCVRKLYFMAVWHMYVVAIRYIMPILVYCVKKNLATLGISTNICVVGLAVR